MEEVYGEASKCREDWDGEVDCPELMGTYCLISEGEVAAAIKEMKIVQNIWSYWCGE